MMFLLAPLLIGVIVYYTAVDALAHRKRKRRRLIGGWLRGLPFNVLVSAWVKAQPEMMAGIREGVVAMKAGNVTPWEEVERELGLEPPL